MKDLFEEIYSLKKLERVGWKGWGLEGRTESDAEHIFSMTVLALEVMSKCKHNLDELKVLKMIAYHELGEIDVGDIALIDKAHRVNKHNKELKGVKRIAKAAKMPEILDLWLEFEEGKTPEAHFVKILDRYDCVRQAKLYSETQNHPEIIAEFYEHAKDEYDAIERMLKNKKID